MNKSLNVRLTLHARKVVEQVHRNPAEPAAAQARAKQTADSYRFQLPASAPAVAWLKKQFRRAK